MVRGGLTVRENTEDGGRLRCENRHGFGGMPRSDVDRQNTVAIAQSLSRSRATAAGFRAFSTVRTRAAACIRGLDAFDNRALD